MDVFDWANFAAITKESDHHPLLEQAEKLVPDNGRGLYALDLGCGGGRGTRFLLAQGWQVTAVDAEAASIAIVSAIDDPNLRVTQSSFQDFDFGTDRYDLVTAQFSLPFVPRDKFPDVFNRIKHAIKPGGIFAGQFFGPNDQWNKPESNFTFIARDQIPGILQGMKVIELIEDDKEGGTATGATKHWHVFHIIAQKNTGEKS